MDSQDDIRDRDLVLLTGIVRGTGHYATPSPQKIERLMGQGLIKRKRQRLAPTLKGRLIAWLWKSSR